MMGAPQGQPMPVFNQGVNPMMNMLGNKMQGQINQQVNYGYQPQQ